MEQDKLNQESAAGEAQKASRCGENSTVCLPAALSLFSEAAMQRGYIKLWRCLADWEWYRHPNMVHLFVHLICKANHRDGKWQGIEIKRGQLVTGRQTLCRETGLSPQVIRTCINRLKSTSEITIKSTSKYSIITVCNYNVYQ